MVLTLVPKRPAVFVAVADVIAILVFVTIGLISHGKGLSLKGYAEDALPLLAGWFGAAYVFKTYRMPTLPRVLATWLVGVTVGIILRMIILFDAPDGEDLTFLAVALAFVLLFVFCSRSMLASMGLRRRA